MSSAKVTMSSVTGPGICSSRIRSAASEMISSGSCQSPLAPLEVFADELSETTSDEELSATLRDPNRYWFEQIEAVEGAGLRDEAEVLRALVIAAGYPVTRQEREKQFARRRR
jgi:hypothetical protein